METIKNSLKPTDQLKLRILKVKENLPLNHKSIFMQKYPEYDNEEGTNKYKNIINLRSSDEIITKRLERTFLPKPEKKKSKKSGKK